MFVSSEWQWRHESSELLKAIGSSIETWRLCRDEQHLAKLRVFSYLKPSSGPKKRPVMFCFNGGPGSASIWLHLGAFGPTRVVFDEPNKVYKAPYLLKKNESSLAGDVDLVFVDPIGTGYSTLNHGLIESEYKKEDIENYAYSVNGDAEYLSGFVQSWLSHHERRNVKKHLLGESYGGIRVALMAEKLQ